MHPAYPEIWRDLRSSDGMEKVAAVLDSQEPEYGVEVLSLKTAQAMSTYAKIRRMALPTGDQTKRANVTAVLHAVRELRASHVESGEKLAHDMADASTASTTVGLWEKLASAVFVDEVLRAKAADDAEAKLSMCLGQEYAVSLVSELLR
jgi:hypothetical protein